MPAQLSSFTQRHADRILVGIGVVLLFWMWHAAHLEWGTDLYVPEWVDARLLLFAAPALILAVLGLVRAALALAFAYPLVIIVGELLGSAAWDLQELFLSAEYETIHGGWAVATVLYAWVFIAAAWGDWRAKRWERHVTREGSSMTEEEATFDTTEEASGAR